MASFAEGFLMFGWFKKKSPPANGPDFSEVDSQARACDRRPDSPVVRRPNESVDSMHPEPPWRVVASLATSIVACVIGLRCWWPAVPGLWTLATFTPKGPIRPMGLTSDVMVGVFGGFLAGILSGFALVLCIRPAAACGAILGMLAALLSMLNFVLFLVIVIVRSIELAS